VPFSSVKPAARASSNEPDPARRPTVTRTTLFTESCRFWAVLNLGDPADGPICSILSKTARQPLEEVSTTADDRLKTPTQDDVLLVETAVSKSRT
jgi:hypothetical protein